MDDAGRPVEHARVRLVPADAPHGALPMTGAMGHSYANGVFVLSGVLQGNYVLVAVPPIVLGRDASPAARGRHTASFQLGGTRPETARGSVATETDDGTTRQFRDELGTTAPVDLTDGSLFEVRIVVKRP
jgi:hypothetical protein